MNKTYMSAQSAVTGHCDTEPTAGSVHPSLAGARPGPLYCGPAHASRKISLLSSPVGWLLSDFIVFLV